MKSLSILAYGEESVESFECLINLAQFYLEKKRSESANRILKTAEKLSQTIQFPQDVLFRYALEVTLCNLQLDSQNPEERNYFLQKAEASLEPYKDYNPEDNVLLFRKNVLLGRLSSRNMRCQEALDYFKKANKISGQAFTKKTPDIAYLLWEIARTYLVLHQQENSGQYFKKAYDCFLEIDMSEAAQQLYQYAPAEVKVHLDSQVPDQQPDD
jgi:tetratricopeptide (TPR) repeat protein